MAAVTWGLITQGQPLARPRTIYDHIQQENVTFIQGEAIFLNLV